MSIEVPHLPFAGGLPEVRDPNARRRGQRRAAPRELPRPPVIVRVWRWVRSEGRPWAKEIVIALVVYVASGYVGVDYRESVPQDPPSQWQTVVIPER